MTLRTVYTIFALYCIFLIGVPSLFGLVGLIHAIRDSIKRRKMPNVIMIVLAVIGIGLLMFDLYCTIRYSGSGYMIYLLLGNSIWPQQDVLFLLIGTLLTVGSLGTYVFLSFHPEDVKSDEADNGKGRDRSGQKNDKDVKAAHEENSRRSVMINRALTIVVCGVIVLAVGIVIIFKIRGSSEHDVSSYTSPDGQYTIVVDNTTLTLKNVELYSGDVYVHISPIFVRKLDEVEGRNVHLEFDPENILWYDDSVLIPYGNTYLTYYIDGIE